MFRGQVYVPILSNPKNHKGWPCVVGEDVKKHIYDLRSVICQVGEVASLRLATRASAITSIHLQYKNSFGQRKKKCRVPITVGLSFQLKGKMSGQTLLPMPMGVERIFEEELKAQQSGGAEVDVRLRSDVEAIVMEWCSQVGDTLHEESTSVFAIDERPQPSAGTVFPRICNSSFMSDPNGNWNRERTRAHIPIDTLSEIEFWRQRLVNVESIYNQMRDPRVKKMASILELTKSPYSACFKTLLKDVVAG